PNERVPKELKRGVDRLGDDAPGMPGVVQAFVVDEGLLDLFHRRAHGFVDLNGRSDDEERVHVEVVLLARVSGR
ncbi:hypothetical protein LXA43DRAFT_855912, partial [Ganoderma leucocontextum]